MEIHSSKIFSPKIGDIMPTDKQFKRVERAIYNLYWFIPLSFVLGRIL